MMQVEVVDILSGYDIDFLIPFAVQVFQFCKLRLLMIAQIRKVFFDYGHNFLKFRIQTIEDNGNYKSSFKDLRFKIYSKQYLCERKILYGQTFRQNKADGLFPDFCNE